MISAAGIKDQELTIIVSMMLIELALLRLSRFKRLALLDTQGLGRPWLAVAFRRHKGLGLLDCGPLVRTRLGERAGVRPPP